MDGAAFAPLTSYHHGSGGTTMTPRITKGNGGSSSNMRKGMMAFLETFRNKQAATS